MLTHIVDGSFFAISWTRVVAFGKLGGTWCRLWWFVERLRTLCQWSFIWSARAELFSKVSLRWRDRFERSDGGRGIDLGLRTSINEFIPGSLLHQRVDFFLHFCVCILEDLVPSNFVHPRLTRHHKSSRRTRDNGERTPFPLRLASFPLFPSTPLLLNNPRSPWGATNCGALINFLGFPGEGDLTAKRDRFPAMRTLNVPDAFNEGTAWSAQEYFLGQRPDSVYYNRVVRVSDFSALFSLLLTIPAEWRTYQLARKRNRSGGPHFIAGWYRRDLSP